MYRAWIRRQKTRFLCALGLTAIVHVILAQPSGGVNASHLSGAAFRA
jgi:hypothetical protein